MSSIFNNENLRIISFIEIKFSWSFSSHTEGSFVTYIYVQKQHLEIVIAISGNAIQGQNPFILGRPVLKAQEENTVINCKI